MRVAPALLVALLALACGNPSRLDHADKAKQPADPWSSPPHGKHAHGANASNAGGSGSDDDGGFDLQGALNKIRDAMDKPGPYESPDASADFDAKHPHIGVLAIHGGVVEREAFSWTGGRGTELRVLIDRLHELAKDPLVEGLVVRFGSLAISLPDVVELRDAMHQFRAAGKTLSCHAEAAINATYLALAACDKIGLAPLGEVAITGPAAMPVHVKGLLDKLAISADFLHVGAYKGAAEPLTRDAPSKEMEETLGAILDRRYATMVGVIADERKLEPKTVQQLIDTGLFTAGDALSARLVDVVVPFEVFRDQAHRPWARLELKPAHKDQLQMWLSFARFIGAVPIERPLGDHVALVYAIGNIVDGGGDGVLGAREQIASHTMVAALRALGADDHVKAVVLRVDSGGGSAQASELIWQEVAALVAKKPVVVSMSDVAASGGYYISSGATKIFALDDTLTGSIGVVGGKLALGGAAGKLGITTFPMGRGKHATMFASLAPWKDDEKAVMQAMMQHVYDQFVARVAAGRHLSAEQVQPIAQGRVWTGAKAKQLGLVDEIGGLDAAIAEAKTLAKLDAASELEVYPPAPTLRDVLVSFGGVSAHLPLAAADAELRALDPELASTAERMLGLVLSFRATPIQALAIVPEVSW